MKNILKNKLSKKIIISLVLVLCIGVGGTMAYLTGFTDTVVNMFTKASIDTEIDEDTSKTDLTKNPSVINKDVTDALVRVRLSISSDEVEDQSIFEKYFGLAGIDAFYQTENVSYTGQRTSEYWKQVGDDRYNCYYYYKKVLTGINGDNPETEPLFDKILKNDKGTYTVFYDDDGKLIDPDKNKEILKYLNSIEITVYQESVPTKITTKNGNVLNADPNGDDIINDEEMNTVYSIFDYFQSNSDTSINN
ncbi:hypothetical protein F300043A5_07760 [Massilimicrobiota timonensis]|uniref:hypothetical protein n=1 Tax=Massilimicrobiota timonensis TaxID=1776392 RepID=UPI0036F26B4B